MLGRRAKLLLFLIISTIFLALPVGYAFVFGWERAFVSPGTIISTLIIGQASVLAIVFSVIFLATQIVSTRYSPTLTTRFVRSRHLKVAFIFISISILFDVLVLVGGNSLPWSELFAGAAIGLPLALFVWFYPFIRKVFERASPSGLIDSFLAEFDAETFVSSATVSNNPRSRDHPFHPVFQLARSAVNNQEIDLAGEGVVAIRDGMFSLLKASRKIDRTFEDEEEEREFYGLLFAAPTIGYLPHLAISMNDEGYANASAGAWEALREVGVKALDENVLQPYWSICEQFVHHIEALDSEDGVYPAIVEEYLTLFRGTARDPEAFIVVNETTVQRVFEEVIGQFEQDDLRDSRYVQMFLEAYAAAQEEMLKEFADSYVGVTDTEVMGVKYEEERTYEEIMTDLVNEFFGQVFDWDGRQEADNPAMAALINWRLGLQWITGVYFQRVDWPAEPGLRPFEVVVKPWKQIVVCALTGSCEAHGRLVLRRFVELLMYVQAKSQEGQYLENLSVYLADVIEEGEGKELVQEVFDVILNEPDRVDVFYRTFGGASRGTGWIPLSTGDYSEEELDAACELKQSYKERMERRTNTF